ncbi:fibronectin type III domain-containing protein [Cellulomonas sp. ES6]|uniref:fibronectin type III domain-containing protein n=1 Tax=Cellulomonas sp. ES6 TaxID=3039384 RepID=UPI0024B86FBB|nr:fibronectin type III domain-containing protein [Cellulomonas sp. ES6]WHP17333.1 fibronectin type III domain-containing protein [Cellulomonas sp. ES6]
MFRPGARTRATRGWRRIAMITAVLLLAPTAAVTASTTALAAGEAAGGTTAGAAVPLPVASLDSSVDVTNAGSSSTGSRNAGVQPYWNNTTWFSYTPAETVRVYIRATSLSPGGWDNTLEVWTAAGTLVAQNDDSYSLDAAVTVTLTAGVDYRIALGAFQPMYKGTARLTFATRVPSPPRDVQATPGDASVAVSWTEPEDLAGGVTSYEILCTPEGGTESLCMSVSGTPPMTSAVVSGLDNGVSYGIRVTASNVIGPSDPAAAPSSGGTVPRAVSAVALGTSVASPASGEPFDVTASVTAGGSPVDGGTVDLTVAGTVHAGLPVVDGVATVTGVQRPAGTTALAATFSGTESVAGSSASSSVEVVKAGQTVTIDSPGTDLTYGGTPVQLVGRSSADLPLTFAASGACTVSDGYLQLTGVGGCEIVATQAGDSETEPASASIQVTVGKRAQHLTLPGLTGLTVGFAPIPVADVSDVGLPVTVTATGACRLVDGAVVGTRAGECELVATAEGDEVTLPATATVSGTIAAVPTAPTVPTPAPSVPATVQAEIGRGLGAVAQGTPVSATGTGLLPGSELVLEVHSTPQVIGTATVGADGTATVTGLLPAGLEAGDHRLIAVGTALDGSRAEFVIPFTLAADGTFARIADQSLPALAVTGSEVGSAVGLSVLWLVAGAGMVLVARRRLARR